LITFLRMKGAKTNFFDVSKGGFMRKGDMLVNILNNRRGSSSIVFVCTAVIIILLSAVVTDIGYIAFQRYKMDKTLDRIAEQGAKALLVSKNECIKVIQESTIKSVDNMTKLDINVSDNKREMSINLERKIDYIFLKYIGFTDKKIDSRVTAKLSNVTSYKGIRPFAVLKGEFVYGKQYYLALNNEQVHKSNEEAILSVIPINIGSGNFDTGILYGYNKTVRTGDSLNKVSQIDFSTANKSAKKLIEKCKGSPRCTYDNYESDCSRIIILPVVDNLELNREKPMKVLGFTAFFIEDIDFENKDAVMIKGSFIKYTVKSSTSDGIPDYGLLGVKLIH